MVTREKTVIYSFPTLTTLATNNTTTNLTQITIYIPEASPTFTSVYAEVGWQDIITATGGTFTNHNVGLRLNASAYTTKTNSATVANTGENQAAVFGPYDFTSHFVANWGGTSATCDLQVLWNQTTGTTTGMRNVTAVLYITYTYDDDVSTNPNQLKTAIIPLESLAGSLTTTTNSNIGSNQIPILTGAGGMLPENSVTIRDYFFIIEGNESNNNTTTDWTLTANIDSSGSPFAFGVQEAALGSDRFSRWIYKPSVPTTTATHQFQLWSSVTTKANSLCINLYVTYQFNAAATTRVLNTILISAGIPSEVSTSSATPSSWNRDFSIQDPGTITLRQSAYRITFSTTAAVTGLNSRAGSQAYRAYTHIGNVMCGMNCFQQRVDSGSAQGAGVSIARGFNELGIDLYATDTTDKLTNVCGILFLNYESDIGPNGIGQNTHVVFKNMREYSQTAVTFANIASHNFSIPESNYWITAIGYKYYLYVSSAGMGLGLNVQTLSTEDNGLDYKVIYSDNYRSDAEISCTYSYFNQPNLFRKYPQDPDSSKLDIESSRNYQFYSTTACRIGLVNMVTYHSFKYDISGTLSNYSGDGSGITVDAFRSDNDQFIGTTTTSIGGSYTIPWYDNTVEVYTVARQSSILLGRSDNDFAS